MNLKVIFSSIGRLLLAEAVLLFAQLVVAIIYQEYNYILPFAVTIVILIIIGLLLSKLKADTAKMFAKEGFVVVGLSWILLSLFGAIPFTLGGLIPNYLDALFETVSVL